MNLVVTLAANDNEIPFHVWAPGFMMLKVVEFEDSWVGSGPALMLPSANPARVPVAFLHSPLNTLGNLTVVRLGNAFFGLQHILSHV